MESDGLSSFDLMSEADRMERCAQENAGGLGPIVYPSGPCVGTTYRLPPIAFVDPDPPSTTKKDPLPEASLRAFDGDRRRVGG